MECIVFSVGAVTWYFWVIVLQFALFLMAFSLPQGNVLGNNPHAVTDNFVRSSMSFSWGFRYVIVTNNFPTQITRKLRCVIETVVVQCVPIIMIDHPEKVWNSIGRDTALGKFITGDQYSTQFRKFLQTFRLKSHTPLENNEQVHFCNISTIHFVHSRLKVNMAQIVNKDMLLSVKDNIQSWPDYCLRKPPRMQSKYFLSQWKSLYHNCTLLSYSCFELDKHQTCNLMTVGAVSSIPTWDNTVFCRNILKPLDVKIVHKC